MELEICVDSLESAIIAEQGGADRVELCSDLLEGGVTPSAGLIQSVRAAIDIGLFVMIRPRGGDILYSASEYEVMLLDIAEAKRMGADGVVLGLLTVDGQVDIPRTALLVEKAHPMQVTFHRAIDMTPDIDQACEDIILTGAHRILTSGGQQTAPAGAAQIARLVEIADSRIAIMAGSGIRAHNVAEMARLTGAREFHGSLRKRSISPVTYRNHVLATGSSRSDEFVRHSLLEDDVRALRHALDKALVTNEKQSVQ